VRLVCLIAGARSLSLRYYPDSVGTHNTSSWIPSCLYVQMIALAPTLIAKSNSVLYLNIKYVRDAIKIPSIPSKKICTAIFYLRNIFYDAICRNIFFAVRFFSLREIIYKHREMFLWSQEEHYSASDNFLRASKDGRVKIKIFLGRIIVSRNFSSETTVCQC
jgi:hypothetical protein